MTEKLALRFGDLEAALAALNGIPSHNRTAFQARLKNFHRLGFPEGIGQGRGKAVIYGARELVLMALAVELTQLGLTPERVIEVIREDEYPVWICVRMAASSLTLRSEVFNPGPGDFGKECEVWGFSPEMADNADTDPLSMFLYCDPAALAPWDDEGADRSSATFFYGGAGVIRDNISRWTTGPTRRLALINVTKLLFDMAVHIASSGGLDVVKQFEAVADEWIHRDDFDLDTWAAKTLAPLMSEVAADPKTFYAGKMGYVSVSEAIPPESLPFVYKPDQDEAKSKPDLVIRLPGQRELIVDAKMMPLADIPQEAIHERAEKLAEHPYRTTFSDKTDYQLLYVPDDWWFASAVAIERHIFQQCLSLKVIVVTPRTLKMFLEEVAKLWAEEVNKSESRREEFESLSSESWDRYYVDDQKA
jgi:hypothetical protein